MLIFRLVGSFFHIITNAAMNIHIDFYVFCINFSRINSQVKLNLLKFIPIFKDIVHIFIFASRKVVYLLHPLEVGESHSRENEQRIFV